VLYVEEYIADESEKIQHQAIYHLTSDDDQRVIRVKVYRFKEIANKVVDIVDLAKLEPDSNHLVSDCDLVIARDGRHFKGYFDPVCEGPSDVITIRENEYTVKRDIYESGNIDHQMVKARCFVCMIDFPREAGGRPVNTVHYIDIHDQGGKFEFDYTDGRHMVLGMRNTWSYGMQRETFVIFIQEGSQEGKTLIYSWGEPGADRIGFNPGWIRVQCDLDTPENRQFQKYLRPDS